MSLRRYLCRHSCGEITHKESAFVARDERFQFLFAREMQSGRRSFLWFEIFLDHWEYWIGKVIVQLGVCDLFEIE